MRGLARSGAGAPALVGLLGALVALLGQQIADALVTMELGAKTPVAWEALIVLVAQKAAFGAVFMTAGLVGYRWWRLRNPKGDSRPATGNPLTEIIGRVKSFGRFGWLLTGLFCLANILAIHLSPVAIKENGQGPANMLFGSGTLLAASITAVLVARTMRGRLLRLLPPLLAGAGVYAVSSTQPGGFTVVGTTAALVVAAGYVATIRIMAGLGKRGLVLEAMTVAQIAMAVVLVIVAEVSTDHSVWNPSSFPYTAGAGLLAGPVLLALQAFAIGRLGSARFDVLTALNTVFAFLIGYLLLNDAAPTTLGLVGIMLVVIASAGAVLPEERWIRLIHRNLREVRPQETEPETEPAPPPAPAASQAELEERLAQLRRVINPLRGEVQRQNPVAREFTTAAIREALEIQAILQELHIRKLQERPRHVGETAGLTEMLNLYRLNNRLLPQLSSVAEMAAAEPVNHP